MFKYPKPIIVIAGPTASGKSDFAIKLAKDINGVIINADSRQIYKEISIGTAKPSIEEMKEVPHFLYGHISVKENYNIYRYQKDVEKVLTNLSKEQIPIFVGGTGLYIDSVVFNYHLSKEEVDKEERGKLNLLSIKELRKLVDPNILKSLNNSDRNNPVRLIRIIEKNEKRELRGKELIHKYFVIDIDKEELNRRIRDRVENMIDNGLIEENINTREEDLNKYPALKTIGYQEFDGYFEKQKSLDDVKDEIVKNTSKYAKRQKTWFRRHKHAIWTNDYDLILAESLKLIKIS
ncbi:MAG: tRNA (adenosine(37)-N6)-dimethylallyltransferase MiaA [Candidatus Dojkabacteria bacterium]